MQKNSSLSHAAQGGQVQPAQVNHHHTKPAQPTPDVGRPSLFSDRMVAVLCSIVRATGISDSGAAARASLHPSTISRWKREFPDFAILLRAAREEFRAAQLELIMEAARSGRAGGWRAAAWLLERTFPQEYSPRAQERARFQEAEDAACAREAEWMVPEDEATQAEFLQNLQNHAPIEAEAAPIADDDDNEGSSERADLPERHHLGSPLQNVQNSAAARTTLHAEGETR